MVIPKLIVRAAILTLMTLDAAKGGNSFSQVDELKKHLVVVKAFADVRQYDDKSERTTSTAKWIQATGFFIAGTNLLCTSYHVVHGAHEIVVTASDGSETWWFKENGSRSPEGRRARESNAVRSLEICGRFPEVDLCVMKWLTAASIGRGFPISDWPLPPTGTKVQSFAHPWNMQNTLSDSASVNAIRSSTWLATEYPGFPQLACSVLQVQSQAAPGSSGGVVLGSGERVVGIIMGGLDKGRSEVNLAIPVGALATRIASLQDSCATKRSRQSEAAFDHSSNWLLDFFGFTPDIGPTQVPVWLTAQIGTSSLGSYLPNNFSIGPGISIRLSRKWEIAASIAYQYSNEAKDTLVLGFPAEIDRSAHGVGLEAVVLHKLAWFGPVVVSPLLGGNASLRKEQDSLTFSNSIFASEFDSHWVSSFAGQAGISLTFRAGAFRADARVSGVWGTSTSYWSDASEKGLLLGLLIGVGDQRAIVP